jgi:hypothetical protein
VRSFVSIWKSPLLGDDNEARSSFSALRIDHQL